MNFAVDGSDFLPQWLKYCSGCHRPYIFLEALNELNKMVPVNGVIARKMNALGQFFPQIILIKAEFYYVVRGNDFHSAENHCEQSREPPRRRTPDEAPTRGRQQTTH